METDSAWRSGTLNFRIICVSEYDRIQLWTVMLSCMRVCIPCAENQYCVILDDVKAHHSDLISDGQTHPSSSLIIVWFSLRCVIYGTLGSIRRYPIRLSTMY
jgi:hypothetical protein